MNFRIENAPLQRSVQTAMSAIERKKATLPILDNLCLKLEDGILTLFSSNSEQEVSVFIDNVDGENGEITVPAKKLHSILKSTDKKVDVEFSLVGEKAGIKIGKSRFSLSTLPASDYPYTDSDILWETEFKIPAKELRSCISKVVFAMANQDVRYYLNGMLLELRDGFMTCVATDGHRLACAEFNAKVVSNSEVSIIIPRNMITEIASVIGDEEVFVKISSRNIQFSVGNTTFASKLIDGKYPDWRGVIPQPQSNMLVCDTNEIKSALNRVGILSGDKIKGVRLNLKDNLVQLESSNSEQEVAEETVEAIYGGEEMSVGFNIGYLTDALNAIKSDFIEMHFTGANSSVLIMPKDDDNVRYVIMPMRL